MREQRTASIPYESTETPSVYRRGSSFTVKWGENGRKTQRTFPTYEEACAFKRDFVVPYRDRRRRHGSRVLAPSAARRLAPNPSDDGWVYFFQSEGPGREVKIGWSRDPARRLIDLGQAHPHELTLAALLPGDVLLERRLHRAFKRWRLKGEWFAPDVLIALVERLTR